MKLFYFPGVTFKTDLAAYFSLSLAVVATRRSPGHNLPCLELPVAEHLNFTSFKTALPLKKHTTSTGDGPRHDTEIHFLFGYD